jgi:hypothetical protein
VDFTDIAILVINVLGLFCGVAGVLVEVTQLRNALLNEGVMARYLRSIGFPRSLTPLFRLGEILLAVLGIAISSLVAYWGLTGRLGRHVYEIHPYLALALGALGLVLIALIPLGLLTRLSGTKPQPRVPKLPWVKDWEERVEYCRVWWSSMDRREADLLRSHLLAYYHLLIMPPLFLVLALLFHTISGNFSLSLVLALFTAQIVPATVYAVRAHVYCDAISSIVAGRLFRIATSLPYLIVVLFIMVIVVAIAYLILA